MSDIQNNKDIEQIWFIFIFYILILIILLFIVLQIKYVDYNDNFRKSCKDKYTNTRNYDEYENITKYYLDMGLTLDESKTMTTLFKQLKLEYLNIENDNDIDEYINDNLNYKEHFYNKKLYKNIIKNTLKKL